MAQTKHIYHKIRGSYPAYFGIELPNDYRVLLLDEDNFNAYRSKQPYQAIYEEVKDQYCHFQKPTEGSWYIVIESDSTYFNPGRINLIYKSTEALESVSNNNSTLVMPTNQLRPFVAIAS